MASERWLCASCGATSDPSPEPPPGCSRCDAPLHVGKFGLLQELGKERSARVFRGRESSGRTEVIVRIFPESLKLDVASIRQAVKRTAALSHPVIVPALDAGTHRNQVYYVETAVHGIPATEAELTMREGISVFRNVALALDYAHGRGVVHPDLRAENILVSREAGSSLGESAWRVSMTCFGVASGGSVRDNVGAFGSILYAAATGSPPRRSGSVPIAPSSINPLVDSELESIILLAMDSSGSQQPPSMEEIAVELGRWLDPEKRPRSDPKTTPEATVPATPLQPWKTWGLLGVSVVIVLLLIYLVIRKAPAPLEPVPVVRTPPPAAPPPAVPPAAAPKPEEVKPVPAPKVEPPAEAPKPTPPPAEAPTPPPPPAKPPEEKPAPPPSPPPAPPKPPPVEEKPAPPPPKPTPVEEKPAPPPPKPAPVEEKPAPPPKPPEDKPAPGVSVGEIFGSHPQHGKFVKLNGKENPAVGDTLVALRKGKVVGTLAVARLIPPERKYPQGCATCTMLNGEVEDGDDIRRVAK